MIKTAEVIMECEESINESGNVQSKLLLEMSREVLRKQHSVTWSDLTLEMIDMLTTTRDTNTIIKLQVLVRQSILDDLNNLN